MILKESPVYPYEEYFWIINNEVIGITSEVPHYNDGGFWYGRRSNSILT
jgi:hypothetical protein